MKVLFVSPEMEPFAKVGGLADVVGALPKELKRLGCDVKVVVPLYRHAKENLKKLKLKTKSLKDEIMVAIDWLPFKGKVEEIVADGVSIYLLQNDALFDRDYIYGTPQGDYPDNDLRFGFLSLGALEVAKAIDFKPDVIHCHDWQTGLLPISLKWRKHLKDNPFFQESKLVFTIHNLAYQGLFDKEILEKIGIRSNIFTPQGVEFYGKVNLLKGGIIYSDEVTTVSPTYAEEIKTPQFGHGLEGVLTWISENSNNLTGILNGIDYDVWNTETDKALYINYSTSDISGKVQNKLKLKEELGLKVEGQKPLLGIVSRLVEQKGVDLIAESLPEIFEMGYQLAILGTGDQKYERMLDSARQTYKDNFALILGFSDVTARRIYAASDMFLMPSRFEPCGLGQMIALRYGSIPIVRGTGGLLDTITDYSENKSKGNGFVLREFSKANFLDALQRAKSVYQNGDEWLRLTERAMKEDFSWKRSSQEYLELYSRSSSEE